MKIVQERTVWRSSEIDRGGLIRSH